MIAPLPAGSPPPPDDVAPPREPEPSRARNGDSPRALVAWTIGMVVLTAALVWAVVLARQVLLLIYVSVLLAIGFSPVVRLLERQRVLPIGSRGLPRWAAILIVYVLLLGAAGGVLFAVLPTLVSQAQEFARHVPSMVDAGQQWLVAHGVIAERLTVGDMVKQAPVGSDQLGTLLTTIIGLLGGMFGLLTILILTFYFLVEADPLFDAMLRLVPRGRRRKVRALCREIGERVSAWLGGQLILAGAMGVTSLVGLVLLGVPYFYVLAIIAAIGELIPYLGPILSAVPAVAIAATVSWKLALATLVYWIAQQQFENYVLVPRVMEQQVGLSAATVIVALLIGASLLGVVGAILAVPTAAILHVLLVALVPTAED